MFVCWSVKGGSGTTVVAAALALVLAQRLDVGARLIDLSGDTPSALGMSEPSSEGIAEWLNAADHPGADGMLAARAGAGGNRQGYHAEDKRQ